MNEYQSGSNPEDFQSDESASSMPASQPWQDVPSQYPPGTAGQMLPQDTPATDANSHGASQYDGSQFGQYQQASGQQQVWQSSQFNQNSQIHASQETGSGGYNPIGQVPDSNFVSTHEASSRDSQFNAHQPSSWSDSQNFMPLSEQNVQPMQPGPGGTNYVNQYSDIRMTGYDNQAQPEMYVDSVSGAPVGTQGQANPSQQSYNLSGHIQSAPYASPSTTPMNPMPVQSAAGQSVWQPAGGNASMQPVEPPLGDGVQPDWQSYAGSTPVPTSSVPQALPGGQYSTPAAPFTNQQPIVDSGASQSWQPSVNYMNEPVSTYQGSPMEQPVNVGVNQPMQSGYDGYAMQQPAGWSPQSQQFAPAAQVSNQYRPAHSKLVAGILGIFLGTFGVHNFYLGNTGRGMAQLLISCIGVFFFFAGPLVSCIWGMLEGILILASRPGSAHHQDAYGVELVD